MNREFSDFLSRCQQRVQQALPARLHNMGSEFSDADASNGLQTLCEASLYSLLNGGKRVRATLVYATAQALNSNSDGLDDIAYDEATAILVGDALQARAFELLANLQGRDADTKLALIRQLSAAAGPRGMVGGQAIDLASVNQQLDLSSLQTMHQLKTGALIRVAISMSATWCQASAAQTAKLDAYGKAIGLSFQVQDDIIDIESNTETLGKTQGADIALNKPTFPALLGLSGAKALAAELHQGALAALSDFDDSADPLRALSHYIIDRQH